MRAKDYLFKTFRTLDRMGLHALPKHYYSPVPDCSWLEENRPLWIGRSSLTGIAWDLAAQFAWLKDVANLITPNSMWSPTDHLRKLDRALDLVRLKGRYCIALCAGSRPDA